MKKREYIALSDAITTVELALERAEAAASLLYDKYYAAYDPENPIEAHCIVRDYARYRSLCYMLMEQINAATEALPARLVESLTCEEDDKNQ